MCVFAAGSRGERPHCHAGGRGFESRRSRSSEKPCKRGASVVLGVFPDGMGTHRRLAVHPFRMRPGGRFRGSLARMELPRRVPLRRGIVARPRLSGALDGGWEGSLTLVVAPAGYGKTVAVEGW